MICTTQGCSNQTDNGYARCFTCLAEAALKPQAGLVPPALERSPGRRHTDVERTMSQKYPKYYKPIPEGMTELDFYAVAQIFGVSDAMISHSMKKLMLPGVRTGGKSRWDDIKEARDTLNRWLELNNPPT